MPTKPPSIGMSTVFADGAIIRAALTRATIMRSGMSKSRISRGGMAPPQGLMRPALSSSSTRRPWRARSCAAVAPDGPPPTTTASKVSSALAIGVSPPQLRDTAKLPRAMRGAGARPIRAASIAAARKAMPSAMNTSP